VTLPKPLTSGAKSKGRFGKQDFAYLPEEDAYRCPAGHVSMDLGPARTLTFPQLSS